MLVDELDEREFRRDGDDDSDDGEDGLDYDNLLQLDEQVANPLPSNLWN